MLEGKTLHVASKEESRTKSEGYRLAMTYKALEVEERSIKKGLGLLHGIQKRRGWDEIKLHLSRKHPRIYNQFSRTDEEGFEMVGKAPFDTWAGNKLTTPPQHLQIADQPLEPIERLLDQAIKDVHSIVPCSRHRLVKCWVEEISDNATNSLFESVRAADTLHRQLRNVHDDVDRRVLQLPMSLE